jgi:hypothetical protein
MVSLLRQGWSSSGCAFDLMNINDDGFNILSFDSVEVISTKGRNEETAMRYSRQPQTGL